MTINIYSSDFKLTIKFAKDIVSNRKSDIYCNNKDIIILAIII